MSDAAIGFLPASELAACYRTKSLSPVEVIDAVLRHVPLATLLGEANFVICLALATTETENLMDAAAFARMKRGAFFINLSRGGLVDEAAEHQAFDTVRQVGGLAQGRVPLGAVNAEPASGTVERLFADRVRDFPASAKGPIQRNQVRCDLSVDVRQVALALQQLRLRGNDIQEVDGPRCIPLPRGA